jgi:hypothetical protein
MVISIGDSATSSDAQRIEIAVLAVSVVAVAIAAVTGRFRSLVEIS